MLHLPILVTVNLSSHTDVQTEPVHTFNGTLKLRLSLMYDDGALVRLKTTSQSHQILSII